MTLIARINLPKGLLQLIFFGLAGIMVDQFTIATTICTYQAQQIQKKTAQY
jgi:hypothetical protein